MATLPIRRPPRIELTDPATSMVELAPPPRQAESPAIAGSMGMIVLPAASGVGAVLLAVTHQDRPLMAAAGLLVLAASIAVGLAMLIGSRTGARRRTREQRERYLDYLEQVRATVRQAADLQRTHAATRHPDPRGAAGVAHLPHRRWERRPQDPDFLVLRVGRGPVARAVGVATRVGEHDPLVTFDPVCLAAAQELAAESSALPDQPVCVRFGTGVVTCVIGNPASVHRVARALLAQVVWAHSPVDVAVLGCIGVHPEHWDWLKWLPHARSTVSDDGPLPARLLTADPAQAVDLLTTEAATNEPGTGRHVVVVVDRVGGSPVAPQDERALLAAGRTTGASLLFLVPTRSAEPERVDVRIMIADGPPDDGPPDDGPPGHGGLWPDSVQTTPSAIPGTGGSSFERPRGGVDHLTATLRCRLDGLDEAGALSLARSFAPLRPVVDAAGSFDPANRRGTGFRLDDLAHLDPARTWRPRDRADMLRAPIGAGTDGSPVVLDLKESAAGGMGPHGLIVGATGSGKSELLRTLVTALVIRHPPETLALLLADFKGGATFSGLSGLPHLAGMVTNLDGDEQLVDRFRDALGGELQRRQELLATVGRLSCLDEYDDVRHRRPDLEAIPHLLVIVDEFSELLGARPDLAELFVTVGRIGRSIGVHLLLATQRLDTGRIRGLESHLAYRICLRTFSETESREAIGRPDAHRLPPEPGWAYLLADDPSPRRFRVAMVSEPRRVPPRRTAPEPTAMVLPFAPLNGVAARAAELASEGTVPERCATPPTRPTAPGGAGPTLLDIVVARVTTSARTLPDGRPARRIWLDPLPTRLALSDLPRGDTGRAQAARIRAPLGLVDLPERQRQDLLEWDCTDGNANVLILGTGRSGKSTAAGTLLASLCLRHAPGDVEVHCVDYGGQGLLPFAALPHVTTVATRSDPDLTRRVFTRLTTMLTERELLFRRQRFASMAQFRQARRDGLVGGSVAGDVVVIIDGWVGVRDADSDIEAALADLVDRGPGLGMHTVLTAAAPHQLRSRLLGGFGRRIELRLSDSFDSDIDRSMARALPAGIPGRALVAGRHYAQLALPIVDAGAHTSSDRAQPEPLADVIGTIRGRWPGPPVPRVRTLPGVVTLAELQAGPVVGGRPDPAGVGLILGMAEDDPQPIRHDLAGDDPHLVIYGDAGSGKTTMLRSILSQLAGQATRPVTRSGSPSALVVIDYRRRLRPVVDTMDELSVVTNAPDAGVACAAIATRLAERPVDRAPEPVYLLVDDYDLVAGPSANPLVALIQWLPFARDAGLRVVIARRAGGAGRAQYEPVLQTLADLGTPVLLLSGPSTEGRLAHGVAPTLLPPGRARLTTRARSPLLMQTPWVPPSTAPSSVTGSGSDAAGAASDRV